jgi:N-acetyl-anhydromuramyl-L-alanine amidase AmpD
MLVWLGVSPASAADSLNIRNRWSYLNKRRPVRPHTKYIVLHTTEGSNSGSLAKIRRYGEAHYFVSTSGRVYRIIEKSKIARHAGRSMWEGQRNIDNYSIGIEVVGYHNKKITDAQYRALRELLRQLKSLYDIPDDNVLTHSMVAYGRPNRFHKQSHRGRKRCGMLFARHDVRERLGLKAKPERDKDVEAGRLKVADRQLHRYLFAKPPTSPVRAAVEEKSEPADSMVIAKGRNAWNIARDQYNQESTTYTFPSGRQVRGDEIRDWSKIPVGTRVALVADAEEQPFEGFLEIGKDGEDSEALAGDALADRTTIYFFPDGLIRTGYELHKKKSTRKLLANPPDGTRVLVGYVYGGYVKTRRLPTSIAGSKWNYPSTYYRFPDGKIVSGDDVDASAIPARTLVFYQN